MNDTENMDEIIRSSLEGHEFPFDDQNWEKARRLIDEDRKKKRRRALFLFFLLPGFLTIGAGVWYAMTKSNTIASSASAAAKSVAVNKKSEAPHQAKYLKATAGNVLKDTFANTIAAKTATTDAVATAEPVVAPPIAQNTNTANSSRTVTKPRRHKKGSQVNDITHTPIIASKVIIKPTAIETTLVAVVPVLPQQDKIVPDPVQSIAAATDTTSNKSAAAGTSDSLVPVAKKDSTVAMTNPAKDSAAPESIVRNRFTVLAGAAYLLAWEKASDKPGNGFNPVAGFSYSRALGKRFAVSAGIQYLSVYNSNSKAMTVNSTHYGFGETKDVITIDPKKLHYITMPIRLSYPGHTKNAVSVGCNIGYLFYSVVETQQYTETPFMRSNIQVTRARGLFNGFNSLDLQLAIAYRRRIYKNFSMEAELFSGLSDIVNNNHFDAGAPQKNKGIKITLQYDLQKFKP